MPVFCVAAKQSRPSAVRRSTGKGLIYGTLKYLSLSLAEPHGNRKPFETLHACTTFSKILNNLYRVFLSLEVAKRGATIDLIIVCVQCAYMRTESQNVK